MPRPTVVPALMTHHATLPELIAEARAGSIDALGALYEHFAPAVMRTALRITRSRSDAEDVLHDVFLHLPESLAHYEEQQKFEGWLSVLTLRAALDERRRTRRRDELLASAMHLVVADRRADHDDEELRIALAALPAPLHRVLVLKQIEGYSHEEIAALIGISVGASRMRLARALSRLRAALRDSL